MSHNGSLGRVAVTSVVRGAERNESSGCFRIVDLDARRVLGSFPISESEHRADETNPRGGVRGARGVSALADRIAVANSDTIFVFDTDWSLQRVISHPWLGGIHDILADDEGIWVTCTNGDLLARVDWSGSVIDRWSWREDRRLRRALGYRWIRRWRSDLDYREPDVIRHVTNVVHVNALCHGERAGELLVSFGRVIPPRLAQERMLKQLAAPLLRSIVARRREARARDAPFPAGRVPGSTAAVLSVRGVDGRLANGAEIAVCLRAFGTEVPNHNILRHGAHVLYNDSNSGELVVVDAATWAESWRVLLPGDPPFARGLESLPGSLVLAGSQRPAALHAVDTERRQIAFSIQTGQPEQEAVYAITRLSDAFDDTPATLEWRSAGARFPSRRGDGVPPRTSRGNWRVSLRGSDHAASMARGPHRDLVHATIGPEGPDAHVRHLTAPSA